MTTWPAPDRLFFNTILLGGSPAEKIRAVGEAGFRRAEIWEADIEGVGGAAGLAPLLAEHDVSMMDLQVLRDFDGAPDAVREAKRREAIAFLDLAVEVGTAMIAVAASTDPASIADRRVQDLRWLSDEAAERGLRVGYESLSWSTQTTTLADTWVQVRDADRENLGVVVDSFHLFVHGRDVSDLDGLPIDKIYGVQLSDLPGTVSPDVVIETARHHRLLPGRGAFDIAGLLARLHDSGYEGPVGIEVFNDEMKAADPGVVAERCMEALLEVLEPFGS